MDEDIHSHVKKIKGGIGKKSKFTNVETSEKLSKSTCKDMEIIFHKNVKRRGVRERKF